MTYDYRYLQSKYPYDPTMLEKVCRISNTLERITQIPFLLERLSLYGGTALNFIHFKQIHRLSVDIDFNYRHQGKEKDWGEIREKIDENLKEILDYQGYNNEDIKINASYPLSRFTINYTNHRNIPDSFKIETGYMKRIPILTSDTYLSFKHICSETEYIVNTPKTEEIYANKIVTMLDRATPRDLYDVNNIEKTNSDMNLLRKCVLIESLISLKQPITEINPQEIVETISYDERIKSVTDLNQETKIEETKHSVSRFINEIINNFTENERLCIKKFYDENQFKPKLLKFQELHPGIQNHPGILWALQ